MGQKEATCYAEGYTGDTYCSTCNHEIERGTSIAKNAHNPASVWTTDETDHWKECQTVGCGNIIDKAHHSGGEATCVNKAICEVCKIEYGDVDATNHKNTEIRGATDPTCCEAGYTGDKWCTDCNTKIESGSEISSTGNHTDVDGNPTAQIIGIPVISAQSLILRHTTAVRQPANPRPNALNADILTDRLTQTIIRAQHI